MVKEFVKADYIRDCALKLVDKMYREDNFIPDVIYCSLRGGAYMANVMSEYYKMVRLKNEGRPVFYAAVVARSYGFLRSQSKVIVDGWTYAPEHLRSGDKILIVDDIFDTGKTVNALTQIVIEQGIPREDIKVAVFDYKVFPDKEQLEVQPDYWCRKHVINKPEDERWIHYNCHEFIGLTSEEIDAQYEDPEVKEILHRVRGDK